MINKLKLFVWDFNGVLEQNSEFALIETSNIILKKFGYSQRFTIEHLNNYYGLKWYELFERIMPGLSHQQYLDLQNACIDYARHDLTSGSKNIMPTDHAAAVLGQINQAGHDQIVISNIHIDDLNWYLKLVGLSEYFPVNKRFGINPFISQSNKIGTLKKYLRNKIFDDIIIIGDSEPDMLLKNVAGGITYLYNHPYLKARPYAADHKISDLREVLREL